MQHQILGLRLVTMVLVYGHAATLVHDLQLGDLLDHVLSLLRSTDKCAWKMYLLFALLLLCLGSHIHQKHLLATHRAHKAAVRHSLG